MRRRTHQNYRGLRAALIEVAATLIAVKGVEAFSVAELTRRTGVSGAAPYRYFSSREAFLAATAAQAARQLAKDIKSATRKGDELSRK